MAISLNNTKNYPENIVRNNDSVDGNAIITWFDTDYETWVADICDIDDLDNVHSYAACDSKISEEDAISQTIAIYWENDPLDFLTD